MKAITVEPGKPESARCEDFPEPDPRDGSILVEAIAVGVCGTDVEIVEGKYGWAPEGATRLVLGHESLGGVIDPGFSNAFKKGDLVVGIVRRPDPVPCPACAVVMILIATIITSFVTNGRRWLGCSARFWGWRSLTPLASS